MSAQNSANLEGHLFEKILAQLYMDLLSGAGPGNTRAQVQDILASLDHSLGIQRPSPEEMYTWAEQRLELDTDIKGDVAYRVLEEVIAFSQGKFGEAYADKLRYRIEILFADLLENEERSLPEKEREQLLNIVINDILALGPLEPILADSSVTEVMVDGPNKIYIERQGQFEDTAQRFRSAAHLMSIIYRIVTPMGRRISESNPIVDARLSDGSRVNIVIPPISLTGPVITIRKFARNPLSLEDMLNYGVLSAEMAQFLRACVIGRLNILVSGGTGAGKTSFLNVLAHMMPDNERIITIENAAELQLPESKKYVVTLESRPANAEGKGEVSIQDLLVNALRMRPDRIILGETRSGEALELIQAINTGHDGAMTTVHATSAPDALHRLETMATHHASTMPVLAIREMIAAAIDVIVQVDRLPDGSRKVTRVAEVLGLEGNVVVMRDIFQFKMIGREEERVVGRHLPTGIIPQFLTRIQAYGVELPLSMFTPR